MNTKSFTLKIAALVITGTASIVNSHAAELAAKVPVDFTVAGKSVAAGSYRIVEQRSGVIILKDDRGTNLAIAMLPVQTSSDSARNTMTLQRKNGAYHLGGYCAVHRGCWSTVSKPDAATGKVEIALVTPR